MYKKTHPQTLLDYSNIECKNKSNLYFSIQTFIKPDNLNLFKIKIAFIYQYIGYIIKLNAFYLAVQYIKVYYSPSGSVQLANLQARGLTSKTVSALSRDSCCLNLPSTHEAL